MIDWFGVAHNAAWVLGLAVILTAFAMASFQTRVQGVRLRQVLRASSFLLPFGVGLFLFCLGVLFGRHTWWQRVLWGLLAVLTAGQVFWLWRDRNGERMGRGQETPEVSRSNTSDGTSIEERE
jgi:hypothetical protein